MTRKGIDWMDTVSDEDTETPKERCLDDLFNQLLLGINWGLVAVFLTSKALHKYYQDLY